MMKKNNLENSKNQVKNKNIISQNAEFFQKDKHSKINHDEDINDLLFPRKKKTRISEKNIAAKAVGLRLKIIRKLTACKLRDFGCLCKIEPGMFGRYERGETLMSESNAIRVAIAVFDEYNLHIDPSWIISGEGFAPFFVINESNNQEKEPRNEINLFQKYQDFYSTEEDKLQIVDCEGMLSIFKPGSVVAGSAVDLKNEEELNNLKNLYCVIKLKNNQEILRVVTYDEDEKVFALKTDNPFKQSVLLPGEIESLRTIFFSVNTDKIAEKFKSFFS